MKTPEFKIGDWVTIINTGFQIGTLLSIGDVVKIKSFNIKSGYDWEVQFTNNVRGGYYTKYPMSDYFRKATPEEIASVTKPKEITEYAGLKIGDNLPRNIICDWGEVGIKSTIHCFHY